MLHLPPDHPSEMPEIAALLGEVGSRAVLVAGGDACNTPPFLADLRRRCPMLRLVCADFEEGPGQRMRDAPWGIPMMALGAAEAGASPPGDAALEAYGAALARDSLAHGVNVVFGPVCDLSPLPDNPIVGTRSAGDDPAAAGRIAAVVARGMARGGVLTCAKHFPGHGRTLDDSHAALPRVRASREDLDREDLAPFRTAFAAGVPTTMTAHVVYNALDRDHPATLSRPILEDLLRGQLGFQGACISDSLRMDGVLDGRSSEEAGVEALLAGCDLLLDPPDPGALCESIRAALRDGRLTPARIEQARARVARLAGMATTPGDAAGSAAALDAPSRALAALAITPIGPAWPRPSIPTAWTAAVVDDDGDLDLSPLRDALASGGAALRIAGDGEPPGFAVLAGRIKAWKGRAGLGGPARERARSLLARDPALPLLVLGSPALIPSGARGPILVAYGAQPPLQEASARVLLGSATAPGRLPVRWRVP